MLSLALRGRRFEVVLMPVATMAELVWHAVAGMCVDEFFVFESVGSIGSIAPSRRYLRSLGTLFLVIFAFVDEVLVFLEFVSMVGNSCSSMGSFYFFDEFVVDAQCQDLLRKFRCFRGGLHRRAMILMRVSAC